MSSHKPRRRRKSDDLSTSSRHGTTITAPDGSKSPAFPLTAFLWPARGGVSQWITLPLILMVVSLYRWCTGLWPYSGVFNRWIWTKEYLAKKVCQASNHLQCMAILRRNGIGWSLPLIFQSLNGTSTTSTGGAWIILH